MQTEVQVLDKICYRGLLFIFYGLCQQQVWAHDLEFLNAIREADLITISRLCESVENINLSDHSGKNALMVASKGGDGRLISKLLSVGADPESRNNNGGTPIMFAAISGDIPSMKLLISRGVDVNLRGSNGWGALMIAVAKGHLNATRLLLDTGAEVNTRDIYLWTPLHRAAFENRIDVVNLLLGQADVEINAVDDQGATALHHAASQGNSGIAVMLIEHGANTGFSDAEGRTPADYASERGHMRLLQLMHSVVDQVD